MIAFDQQEPSAHSEPLGPQSAPDSHLISPYLFGVLLPLCLQIPAILMWSFLPARELVAGEVTLVSALDDAALTLVFPGLNILFIGLVIVSVPFVIVHVLCARALGRSAASGRVIFFVGLLNPCTALLLIIIGLRVWLEYSVF